jgi:hypothetical protein
LHIKVLLRIEASWETESNVQLLFLMPSLSFFNKLVDQINN